MGYIGTRVLASGREVYDVCVELPRSPEGKRRQRWVRGLPSLEAAADVGDVLSNRGASRPEPQGAAVPTVGAYFLEWLQGIRSTVRVSTFDSYVQVIEGRILPRLGEVSLADLGPETISCFYRTLLVSGRRDGKGGLSPQSVRYCHTLLRRALADATRRGLIGTNPAGMVSPPRAPRPEVRTWTAQEVNRFLSEVKNDQLYAAWMLLVMTGLRRGELLGLRWSDIDLPGRRLHVRRAFVSVRYRIVVSEPKTARGRRAVALDETSVATLGEHQRSQVNEGLFAHDGLVFCSPAGAPIHPDRLYRAFGRHAAAAGLPPIRLHDLRHTHATLALEAGINPKVVSERLGHSSVSITLDTYSHVIPPMQAEAAERVAGLILSA